MMRRAFAYFAASIAGCALGLGSALWMAGIWPEERNLAFGDVAIDGWRSDFAIGSKAADPYTRARVARHGLLALAQSEAVYFNRSVDDTGQPLRDSCTYRLSGGAMPAEWWSVTLYDSASMLPDNTDNALSIDASLVGPAGWEAIIAPRQPEATIPWISSRSAGNFDLTLRLYNPETALTAAPEETLKPPRIEQISCGADT